jgi:KipI family sensor histidine kinase inhibitor
MDLRLTRLGPHGILIRFADGLDAESLARCRGLVRWIDDHPPEALVDCVPACESILLEFDGPVAESRLRALELELKAAAPLPAEEATLHRLPVRYDGPDLAELAERKELSVREVVERHSQATYSVYVVGFSPGFPYLGPLDERLHMPRRSSPRLRVPAGSVGIGGEHTGIYSIASPGGWWLIGHTDTAVFSPSEATGEGRTEAFLLRPGDRVRFEPVSP